MLHSYPDWRSSSGFRVVPVLSKVPESGRFSSGKCPCLWQRVGTGWSLGHFPTHTILWFPRHKFEPQINYWSQSGANTKFCKSDPRSVFWKQKYCSKVWNVFPKMEKWHHKFRRRYTRVHGIFASWFGIIGQRISCTFPIAVAEEKCNITWGLWCGCCYTDLTPKESQKVQKHQSLENHQIILKFSQPSEPVWVWKICLKISQEFRFSQVSSPPLDPGYSLTNTYENKKEKHHLEWLFSKVSVLFCNKFWMQAQGILFLGQGQPCFSTETAMSHPFSFFLIFVSLNLKKKIIISFAPHGWERLGNSVPRSCKGVGVWAGNLSSPSASQPTLNWA